MLKKSLFSEREKIMKISNFESKISSLEVFLPNFVLGLFSRDVTLYKNEKWKIKSVVYFLEENWKWKIFEKNEKMSKFP